MCPESGSWETRPSGQPEALRGSGVALDVAEPPFGLRSSTAARQVHLPPVVSCAPFPNGI